MTERQSIRLWKLVLALWFLPPAWMIVHQSALSGDGLPWVFLLWMLGGFWGLYLLLTKRRHLQPSEVLAPVWEQPLRRKIALCLLASVFILVSVQGILGKIRDSRIEEVLGQARKAPCEIQKISTEDRASAAWRLESKIEEFEEACTKAPKLAARERAKREKHEAIHEACAALLAHANGNGDLSSKTADVLSLGEDEVDVWQRVADARLLPKDFDVPSPPIQCDAQELSNAYYVSLGRSPDAWKEIRVTRETVLEHVKLAGMSDSVKETLREAAGWSAEAAIANKKLSSEDLLKVIRHCETARFFSVEPKDICQLLEKEREHREKTQNQAAAARESLCRRLRELAMDCDNDSACELESECERRCWARYDKQCN